MTHQRRSLFKNFPDSSFTSLLLPISPSFVLFPGALALYAASSEEFQLIRMLPNTVALGDHLGPHALTVSGDGLRLAFVGPSEYTVTVADARSLDEVHSLHNITSHKLYLAWSIHLATRTLPCGMIQLVYRYATEAKTKITQVKLDTA